MLLMDILPLNRGEYRIWQKDGSPSAFPCGLVVQEQVVDDDAVQQSYVYSPNGNLAVQYGSQFIGNKYRHLSLNGWNVQQQYGTDIQSQYNTEYPAYCFF